MILSGLGYLFLSLWGGWESVKDGISKIGWDGLILALSFSLINYFIRFNRWNYFLLEMDQKVPFWNNLRIYIAGFSLTATPGKSGEAIRGLFLHDFGVPYRKSFAAFLAERFSDLFAIALLAVVGIWKYHNADYIVMGTLAFILLILFVVQKDRWLHGIEQFAKRRLPERFSHGLEFLLETIVSFRACFTTKSLTVGTVLGVIAWAAEGVAFYFILQLLHVDISLYSAIAIYAISLLVGALTFLPGGLGGTEVTMIQLLMLAGASPAPAATATIMIRLATLWFSVFLGLLALPKSQITIKEE
jgi:uncharacterized protein (TIRG00374 family)